MTPRSRRGVTCGEDNCGKLLDFAVIMPAREHLMPVDRDSADKPGGNLAVWVFHGELRCRVLKKGEPTTDGEHRGTPHFATCTNPGRWRRRQAAS